MPLPSAIRSPNFLSPSFHLAFTVRQPIVQRRIQHMKQQGKAFLTGSHYQVGSAIFTKAATSKPDLAYEFFAALTSL
jgi:hypothetical protein